MTTYITSWGLPTGPLHHKRPVLTPAQRDEIGYRRMEGATATALALEFGVSAKYVYGIAKRERP